MAGFAPQISLVGAQQTIAMFERAAARAKDLTPVLVAMGQHMVTNSIPQNFRERGRPTKWPAANRWGKSTSDPLFDTGALLRGVSYEVRGQDLFLQEGLLKGRLLQYGGTVVPKRAKVLVRPIVGPGALTVSQARTMGPRDFHGAFALRRGPEGPGIYWKTAIRIATTRRTKSGKTVTSWANAIARIFAFMDRAVIPARPFLLYQLEDGKQFVVWAGGYLLGEANWRSLRALPT